MENAIDKLKQVYLLRNNNDTRGALRLLSSIDKSESNPPIDKIIDSLELMTRLYKSSLGEDEQDENCTIRKVVSLKQEIRSDLPKIIESFITENKPKDCYWAIAEYLRKYYNEANSLNLAEKVYSFFVRTGNKQLAANLYENYLYAARVLKDKYDEPGQIKSANGYSGISLNDIPLRPLSANGNKYPEEHKYVSCNPCLSKKTTLKNIFVWARKVKNDDIKYWQSYTQSLSDTINVCFVGVELNLSNIWKSSITKKIKDFTSSSLLKYLDEIALEYKYAGKTLIVHAGIRLSPSMKSYISKFNPGYRYVICPKIELVENVNIDDSVNYINAINDRILKDTPNKFHLRASLLCTCFDISSINMCKPEDDIYHLQHCATELFWRLENSGSFFVSPKEGFCEIDNEVISDIAPLFKYSYSSQETLRELYPLASDRKFDKSYKVPLLDIYIPMYNSEEYIEDAIKSVLNQSVKDIRICISDDGSTDRSVQIVKKLQQSYNNIVLELHDNSGISFTTMKAIGIGNGLLIGQLDSDDRLLPDAAEKLIRYLLKEEELGCVYGSCERINAEGNYVMDEYSFPIFSRHKMLSTSICHHFRMWKRKYYNRTSHFNPFIVNGIDFDFFSKLCEVTRIEHIDEIMYQRRWHGANTSILRERDQTRNTYICILNSLNRQGLQFIFPICPNIEDPRKIHFVQDNPKVTIIWYPDYSYSNPYQNLLYKGLDEFAEIKSGQIERAIEIARQGEKVIFHLHWLNFIFNDAKDEQTAHLRVTEFVAKLRFLIDNGGKLIWTIHNNLEHDKKHINQDLRLRASLCALSDYIHLHDMESISELIESNPIPSEKIIYHPHGNYLDAYGKFDINYRLKNINKNNKRILVFGQLRKYKDLTRIINNIKIATKHGFRVTVAGKPENDEVVQEITDKLSDNRLVTLRLNRIRNDDLHELLSNHEFGLLSYTSVLTSGTLRLFQSYGLVPIAPEIPLFMREIKSEVNGFLYSNQESFEDVCLKINNLAKSILLSFAKENYLKAKELDWTGKLIDTLKTMCENTDGRGDGLRIRDASDFGQKTTQYIL